MAVASPLVRSVEYGPDAGTAATFRRREIRAVRVEPDLVVEELATGFCGAVVAHDRQSLRLEDRFGAVRSFPYDTAGFALDGETVTLLPAVRPAPGRATRTASGSVPVSGRARVARAGRLLVEGVHDAALVERVWGADLRVEGVVVEVLEGVDNLAAAVRELAPGPGRRLGVLVDHLVPDSKETRVVAQLRHSHVLVLGHPYVDVWEAVKPSALGIAGWPTVPRGTDWKTGVCAALGERGGPQAMWRRVLGAVETYTDLQVPLLRAVEQLVDFVTADEPAGAR